VYPITPGLKDLSTDASGNYLTHDLFSNTFQVTAQQVADSSRWYSGFTVPSDQFQEDLEWSLAYFENNIDSSLYARIHAKLLTYEERCRGGPLFFKLLNDETTTNSNANKKALGEVRVDPRALSKIYHWDGQTLCPHTDCFGLF
jgi:hypothetical protein